VAQQSFASPQGAFQATLSIGVAGYPDDAREKAEIIARADQSLYAAKHGGRNRTVCFGDLERKPKLVPAAAAK
jgi:diguanylate cyclase (GGDEF)-like protein